MQCCTQSSVGQFTHIAGLVVIDCYRFMEIPYFWFNMIVLVILALLLNPLFETKRP